MSTRTRTAVTELDPTDAAAVEGALQVRRLVGAHDTPDLPPICRHRFRAQLDHPWPGELVTRWIARDRDEVVGHLEIMFPTLDNLDNAFVEISVPPLRRRRGIGRALYEHAVAHARDRGRRRVMAFTPMDLPGGVSRDPAGSAFAAAMGLTNALDDVRRRLDISAAGWPALDALLAGAWPRADGYSLVQWTHRLPDEYLGDLALLDSQFIELTPMGDLAWEPQKVDAGRIRGNEATRELLGSLPFSTAARHDATGRVVAWTTLSQECCHPDHAWQAITLVHPAHRGHRLGLIIKIENLRYAVRHLPALRYIDTWNAAVNEHMIAINDQVGFRPVESWRNWQGDI